MGGDVDGNLMIDREFNMIDFCRVSLVGVQGSLQILKIEC